MQRELIPALEWQGTNGTRIEGENTEAVDVLLSLFPPGEHLAPALEEVLGKSWTDLRQNNPHMFYPDCGIRIYWTSNWGRDVKFGGLDYGEPFADQKNWMTQ